MPDNIEEKISQLYQMAKDNPDDTNLQSAVELIKTLRRSRGSLQGWNERYRGDIRLLNTQIESKESEITILQTELDNAKQEVNHLIEQKRLALIERDKVKAELRNIEIEIKVAVAQIKENHSWYGKFMILWNFIRSVFVDIPPDSDENGIVDNPNNPDSPRIINDLDDLKDKTWMKTDTASSQRDLLGR